MSEPNFSEVKQVRPNLQLHFWCRCTIWCSGLAPISASGDRGSLSRSVIRALFALVLQPLLIRESQDIERAKATSPELDVFRKWVMPIRRSRCEGGCDSGRQERVLKRPASKQAARILDQAQSPEQR